LSFKKSDTVRWGIIGVGNVTEVKSGPAFYKVPNSSLVAVMRRNKDKLADYARRHKVANYYTNASELINDPRVDAVYIATPPSSHAHYAIEAMRAGKPVYVEKPMAKTYAECMEMLKVSEEMQVPLFVAYYRRTLPAFLKVKNLIEEDTIGNPLFVNVKLYKQAEEKGQSIDEMHWHVFPEIAGAGHFYDLASHQFDYLDFIFGAVTNVKGMASNRASLYPAEDTVTASWEHESGVIGSGSWCFVVDKSSVDDEIKIVGEKGEISIPCFSHGKLKLTTEKGTTEMDFINPENISQNLVQQVVQELRGEGKCVSTGISAARSSWVLEEVVKNYYAK
jgi:predicted dehydrogenase